MSPHNPHKQEKSTKPKFGASLFKMAEQRGFEPPQPCDPNDLANRPLQPLEYCSVKKMAGAVRIELTTYGFGDMLSLFIYAYYVN